MAGAALSEREWPFSFRVCQMPSLAHYRVNRLCVRQEHRVCFDLLLLGAHSRLSLCYQWLACQKAPAHTRIRLYFSWGLLTIPLGVDSVGSALNKVQCTCHSISVTPRLVFLSGSLPFCSSKHITPCRGCE